LIHARCLANRAHDFQDRRCRILAAVLLFLDKGLERSINLLDEGAPLCSLVWWLLGNAELPGSDFLFRAGPIFQSSLAGLEVKIEIRRHPDCFKKSDLKHVTHCAIGLDQINLFVDHCRSPVVCSPVRAANFTRLSMLT
jgi:hypothetical protein